MQRQRFFTFKSTNVQRQCALSVLEKFSFYAKTNGATVALARFLSTFWSKQPALNGSNGSAFGFRPGLRNVEIVSPSGWVTKQKLESFAIFGRSRSKDRKYSWQVFGSFRWIFVSNVTCGEKKNESSHNDDYLRNPGCKICRKRVPMLTNLKQNKRLYVRNLASKKKKMKQIRNTNNN